MANDLLAAHGVVVHPLAEAFPMIRDDDWEPFKADIDANGIRQPILWSHDGTVLVDGRNRLTAWLELGHDVDAIPSERVGVDIDEYALIASLNIARRHMTSGQRACTAARGYDAYADRAHARQLATLKQNADRGVKSDTTELGKARDEVSKAFTVANSYVDYARRLMRDKPDIFKQVETGAITMNKARTLVDQSVGSNLRTDQIAQPVRELLHAPSEIIAWFRDMPLEVVQDAMKRVSSVVTERENSVHGGSDPFSVSDAGQLSHIRAQEINDMRARRDA